MKRILLCNLLLAVSMIIGSSAHGHRHKDIDVVSSRIGVKNDSPNATGTTNCAPISSPFTATLHWASIPFPKKDKKGYDIASEAVVKEARCSDAEEEGDASDGAYFAKVMALALLAGALMI